MPLCRAQRQLHYSYHSSFHRTGTFFGIRYINKVERFCENVSFLDTWSLKTGRIGSLETSGLTSLRCVTSHKTEEFSSSKLLPSSLSSSYIRIYSSPVPVSLCFCWMFRISSLVCSMSQVVLEVSYLWSCQISLFFLLFIFYKLAILNAIPNYFFTFCLLFPTLQMLLKSLTSEIWTFYSFCADQCFCCF